MGSRKPAPKKKKTNQARSARKPVKKTAAQPTKDKARKTPAEKKPTKSPGAEKLEKKPVKPAKPAKPTKPAKPAPAVPAKPAPPKTIPAKARSAEAPNSEKPRLSAEDSKKQLAARAKTRAKTPRATAFTLDDVRGELAKVTASRPETTRAAKPDAPGAKTGAPAKKVVEPKAEQRRFGAASLADILGFNPNKEERPAEDESLIDPKFLKYHKLLIQLRNHVKSGLDTRTEETLKRSSREDAGDLSGYGQHMADAGTDAFDRDFALSMVSTEQEALFEIEEAIARIKKGTYGICERTGKPISRERLVAVPFARFSVESQAEFEKTRRRRSSSGGLFGEAGGEDGAKLVEEDSE